MGISRYSLHNICAAQLADMHILALRILLLWAPTALLASGCTTPCDGSGAYVPQASGNSFLISLSRTNMLHKSIHSNLVVKLTLLLFALLLTHLSLPKAPLPGSLLFGMDRNPALHRC